MQREMVMRLRFLSTAALAVMVLSGAALADTPATAPIAGTRLELSADGQVTRPPDIATLSAGVQAARLRRRLCLRNCVLSCSST